MGQVWSKASCDGIRELGYKGGIGSVIAVTGQNPGRDGVWNTADDLTSPMNERPGHVTLDARGGSDCQDGDDRVRGFAGKHDGGVVFVFADGSTRLIDESIDAATYRAMSTMAGGELVSGVAQ